MLRAQHDDHQRNLRAAARQYRKQGYEVVEHPRGVRLPPFLNRFSPDLIATRDDDHVVLEIKRREELKGSNEFVALAAAVEQQAGWRLELIHLASRKPAVVGSDAAQLARLVARSLMVQDAGLHDAALIYALSVLEELIRDVAAQHRAKTYQLSTRAIVSDLVFLGVLSETAADALDRAWERRDRIMHGSMADQGSDRAAITELIQVCREVQAAMQLQAA